MRNLTMLTNRSRSRAPEGDEGFLLLESIVAIGIITVVMTALTGLLVSVNHDSARQRGAQAAARIAAAAVDQAHAIGAADAVSGRDATSANAQLTHAAAVAYPAQLPTVAPWLADMTTATDSSALAGTGAHAALPTLAVPEQQGGLTFQVSNFVGYCWRSSGSAGDCVKTQSTGTVQYVRVVVAVAWSDTACGPSGCVYVTATLLDGTGDPVFDFNQTPPPSPQPVVPDQINSVGDTVAGVAGVSGCASPCAIPVTNGVPPMTFTVTGLPPGLAMSASGIVTGKPTAKGTYSVAVTATDAFLNSGSTSFTWTIGTPLAFDQPKDQSSVAGSTLNPTLTMTGATGGVSGTYTWAASGLPAGLSIATGTGVISGTISSSAGRSNPYPVTVTLTRGAGSVTRTFNWTVARVPLAVSTVPGQFSDKGVSIGTFDLSPYFSGGSGSVTWSDPGRTLPSGLQITGDGQGITGTPTVVKNQAVSLTVTDTVTHETKSVAFTWSVVTGPVLNYANKTTSNTSYWSSYTASPDSSSFCAGQCQYTVQATQPYFWGQTPASGFSVDNSGVVTKSGPTTTTYTVTVKVTDGAGLSTSDTFTWKFTS